MSADANDSLEISNITTKNSSVKPDEVQYRTEELKKSLTIWRSILLPLNNLLEWEHKYDPFIIFGILSFIFIFIHQINPPLLTLVSCVVLIIILSDLLGPVGIRIVDKNKAWTSINDAKYSRLCEHIAYFEQYIKHKCESVLKMRQERPIMYLMAGGIFLGFLAICGQRINNLVLAYLTTLIVCLIPGVRNRQLIQLIRRYFTDFWNNNNNNNKSISSSETNKPKTQ